MRLVRLLAGAALSARACVAVASDVDPSIRLQSQSPPGSHRATETEAQIAFLKRAQPDRDNAGRQHEPADILSKYLRPPPCSEPAPTELLPVQAARILSEAEECALKPRDIFRECEACPEMIVIPAGAFIMGSAASEKGHDPQESPQHEVTFGKPFAVGRFAVTVGELAAFVKATGHDTGSGCLAIEGDEIRTYVERHGASFRSPGFPQTDLHPATCIDRTMRRPMWHGSRGRRERAIGC